MRFEKEGTLTRAVLITLGLAGLALVAVTAPNAIRVLLPLVSKQFGRDPNERSLERALEKLKKRRMVRFVLRGGKTSLEITKKGRKRLREFEFESMALPLPKRWDGQWTAVLFDIPHDHKRARDALREKLKRLGCFQYQKSVFVHPADCGDEVDFVSEFFDVGRFVTHFRAPSLGKQESRAARFFGFRQG